MRILYVMGGMGKCGGSRVVFHHCAELRRLGHDAVYGVTGGVGESKWVPLDVDVPVKNVWAVQYEQWDAVVATGYKTWLGVHDGFPRAKSKWGFVQMKESLFLSTPRPNYADAMFSLGGFRVFTISRWLKEYLEEDCGQKNVAIVPNGVDTNLFYPDPMDYDKTKPIALVVGHGNSEAKNVIDAATAIRFAGDFELWHVIDHYPLARFDEDIGPDTLFIDPPQDELRQIYSTADILVMSSRAEGRTCLAPESMACKTPVVAMDHHGTDDLKGGRALIADAKDVGHLVDLIRETMDDIELTQRRVSRAYNYVCRWLRWERIGKMVEALYEGSFTG